MSETAAPEVLTEVVDGVLIVTINRPDAKNAMTRAAAEGIAAAMDRLDAEDDLRVGILTGAGGTFCSGMDLKGFLRGERPTVEGRGFGGVVEAPPKKPLIAAVEGYALAGGLELMIACDLVVAHAGAKFGIPEVKRGLVAAAGGVMMLPDQIPQRVAMELALTGDFVSAGRAYELGLVNQVVAPDALLAAASALAQHIVQAAPLAVMRQHAGVQRVGVGQDHVAARAQRVDAGALCRRAALERRGARRPRRRAGRGRAEAARRTEVGRHRPRRRCCRPGRSPAARP